MPPTKLPDLSHSPVYAPQRMLSDPGIQRDGTRLSRTQYIDGVWTRFYQDLPRKMLGFREQQRSLDGVVRALDVESYDGFSYVHAGQQDVLQRYTVNIQNGLVSGLIDRTPSGFAGSPNNNWQFTVMYDTANDANLFFAHAAPNILDISDTTLTSIYYGSVQDTNPLIELVPTDPSDIAQVSGGVVAIWPYLVRYGQDGFVGWSPPGDPTQTSGSPQSGTARPSGTKIVRGLPLRGTSGPACLLWSLTDLILMQFIGGASVFTFSNISSSSTILSSNSVIEHMGIYYWATVSGFAMFNGVMADLPNEDNCQFFLDNLNFNYRQKVFAMKVPRWHEIWWCFPKGNATECNWAIIYNIAKNYWYDTPLPTAGRSAGVYEQVYHYPIMSSALPNQDNNEYSTWQHEFGLDEISGAVPISKAIPARIKTNEKNLLAPQGASGVDKNMSFNLLEPDFHQAGDLSFWTESRQNARATPNVSSPVIIPGTPATPQEELTKFKMTGRLVSFIIESNAVGGNFSFGVPLVHMVPSDSRRED